MIEKVIEFLDKECRRKHYYCEDSWYSCPMHEDGSADDYIGPECNCGAEKFNKQLDKVIEELKEWNKAVLQNLDSIKDTAYKTKEILNGLKGGWM